MPAALFSHVIQTHVDIYNYLEMESQWSGHIREHTHRLFEHCVLNIV